MIFGKGKTNTLLTPEQEISKLKKELSDLKKPKFQSLKKSIKKFKPPEEDFSFQQQVLMQTIGGHGGKIWGQIREPVHINNDLHPSLSDSYNDTSRHFGF